jgi:transcriptional regulator with XRE-family HTH domain
MCHARLVAKERGRLFSALLKYWRQRRGLSQLDLALAADVSARHLSFLETGRAQPSREMVLRLGATLTVPLRDQNALLVAAGMPEAFAEPSFTQGMPDSIRRAVERMAAQQEPYPLIAMNRAHDILYANLAAQQFVRRFVADPARLAAVSPNAMRLLFDPKLSRPFIADWERVASNMLGSLYREMLTHPEDERLPSLFEELKGYDGVPATFRDPDLGSPSEPTFTLKVERDGLSVGFLTALTAFTAPQNVTLEEIRIESYFPLDDQTAQICERFASEAKGA